MAFKKLETVKEEILKAQQVVSESETKINNLMNLVKAKNKERFYKLLVIELWELWEQDEDMCMEQFIKYHVNHLLHLHDYNILIDIEEADEALNNKAITFGKFYDYFIAKYDNFVSAAM